MSNFTDAEKEAIRNDPEIQQLVLEGVQEQADPYGYPEPPSRDSILQLFRDVLGLKDETTKISKTGNLKDGEIGFLAMPVRNYLDLALFSEKEDLDSVSDFFEAKSNIMVSTSLSRKAKFLDLAISQKRVSQTVQPKSIEVKKGLFGTTTVESGGDE